MAGARVFVHFGATATAAVSTDGKVLWKTQLPHANQHGQGSSPALVGDTLRVVRVSSRTPRLVSRR